MSSVFLSRRIFLFRALIVAAGLASGVSVRAQESPRLDRVHATVTGVTVDSLRGGALSGARVVVEGTERAGVSDSTGRFTIDSVPVGPHRLSLMHPFLDTLGLSIVSPPLEFAAGNAVGIVMAIPSAETVVRAKCGPVSPRTGSAALLGMVVTGDVEDPVEGADIWLTWTEVKIGLTVGVSQSFHERRATTGASGRFIICGLPSDLSAEIVAWHGRDTTAAIPVDNGQSFLTLLTLGLPSESEGQTTPAEPAPGFPIGGAAPRRGQSAVRGSVRDGQGVPIEGATIAIDGATAARATDATGGFTLRELASGSHRLTVKAAGYDPVDIAVNLNSTRVSEVHVTLTEFSR